MLAKPKHRAVVICPGRGTYNKEQLGYLRHYHADHPDRTAMLDTINRYRLTQHQPSVSQLDEMASYQMKTHTAGEHASALIYACAMADLHSIDTEQYEIVAITGNSMGWYIALAAAQALDAQGGIQVVNTMGSMMTTELIGGQIIYPLVDENWQWDHHQVATVQHTMDRVAALAGAQVYTSIRLGGYIVLGANQLGLQALMEQLPKLADRYPMKLYNHAAFHTPLLKDISAQALTSLPNHLFHCPKIPLIDGRGHIWQPYSTDIAALHQYTFGHQVHSTYDFSAAIRVAIKEFAPDKLIILGPGATLGGAVAQELIKHHWQGFEHKDDFIQRQQQDPYVLAMGIPAQRQLVTC